MYSFRNDYSEGALPEIMEVLCATNLEQTPGYGCDTYCKEAAERIKECVQAPEAAVHFLVGGTQTNQTALAAFLRPHQAVIGADTAHINVHETGAIETTGHKVLSVPTEDGKLTPAHIEAVVAVHEDEHMVQPKIVYISDSTEVGTIYTKKELAALSACCKRLGLYFYLDGARLGSALTCKENDVTLADLAQFMDAFYIGGTKNGALFGEALVIVNPALQEDFRYVMKQHGGMLAKGRLLGLQFKTLFTNDLFFKAARHANEAAEQIRSALEAKNVPVLADSPTNQLFPIVTAEQKAALAHNFIFEKIKDLEDGRIAIRFVTSFATKQEDVDALVQAISDIF